MRTCFIRKNQIEKSIFILDAMEATLTSLMEEIEANFPRVKTFSLAQSAHCHPPRLC